MSRFGRYMFLWKNVLQGGYNVSPRGMNLIKQDRMWIEFLTRSKSNYFFHNLR